MCNYKRSSFLIPFVEGHDGYYSSCDTIAWAGEVDAVVLGEWKVSIMRKKGRL